MNRLKRYRNSQNPSCSQPQTTLQQGQESPSRSISHYYNNITMRNDRELRFKDRVHSLAIPTPCSLSINLNKFETFFNGMKGNKANDDIEFRCKSREGTYKRTMITYRRFPKKFVEFQTSQRREITDGNHNNNFIVERVKGNLQPSKYKAKGKVTSDPLITDNFTNPKMHRSIKLIKGQNLLSYKNRLTNILSLPSRTTIQKTVDRKMTYKLFLDLVMSSNGLRYKEINFPHFYNVYIEGGNNHQILKTLARRKNGWRVVQCPEVANLIWTQKYKKHLAIRPKRGGNMVQYLMLRQEINVSPEIRQNNESIVQTKDAIIGTPLRTSKPLFISITPKNPPINKTNRKFLQVSRESMKSQISNSSSQSYSKLKGKIANLSESDIKEEESYQTLVGRVTKQKPLAPKFCREYVASLNVTILNHMPGNRCICDKKNLLSNLHEFYTARKRDPFKYIPYSITIRSYQQFEQVNTKLQSMNIAWIVKPGEDSNRGKGIAVCTDWAELVKEVSERLGVGLKQDQKGNNKDAMPLIVSGSAKPASTTVSNNNSEILDTLLTAPRPSIPNLSILKPRRSLILQRYIEPLLYSKRKFDIRMYLLVTCSNGKLKAYIYQEGYIRTCSMQFSMKSSNRYIHLTNDAVQMYATDYGRYEQGNKLSFKEFGDWLERTPRANQQERRVPIEETQKNDQNDDCQQTIGNNFCQDNIQNSNKSQNKAADGRWGEILQEISEMSRDVIRSVKDKLILPCERSTTSSQVGCLHFQLYGLDFMIDQSKKLWLIEVNSNPALTTDCSRLLSRIIPNMLDNMFMIAVQPYIRPHRIRQGNYQNKFAVIYEQ